jgi:dTDP-4-dehydrorhamnose reductase
MKILITGVTGLLGKYLVEKCPINFDIHGIAKSVNDNVKNLNYHSHQLDLLNFNLLLKKLKEINPDVIIHTAGEGGVDLVQNQMELYRPLNVGVTEVIAQYCEDFQKKLVFVSSNAIYGGSESSYSDYSDCSPINDYGILKCEAEKTVKNLCSNYLIVRPIMMYGWPLPGKRINPVVNWINLMRDGKPIFVVNDVWTQPLAAWDCAEAIWKAILINMVGAVNISGDELISLYEFALLTGKIFNLNNDLIKQVNSAHFMQLAPRPSCTIFDLIRLKNELKIEPEGNIFGLEVLRNSEKPD